MCDLPPVIRQELMVARRHLEVSSDNTKIAMVANLMNRSRAKRSIFVLKLNIKRQILKLWSPEDDLIQLQDNQALNRDGTGEV